MSKNLKVLGMGVLLIGLAVAGWFLVTGQSQKNADKTQDNMKSQKAEMKNDVEMVESKEQKQVAKNDADEGGEQIERLKAEDIDTSNWKTYRNEEYGFEVKYPEEYYLNISNGPGGIEISKDKFYSPASKAFIIYTEDFIDIDDFLSHSIKKYDSLSNTSWLFGKDKKDDDYDEYRHLLFGFCSDVSINVVNEQRLSKNIVHQIGLVCKTKDSKDAQILTGIFKSFKFLNK
jgi:hypothetical protein